MKEVENISPFQVMALNPIFDVFEQLPNFNNTYIFYWRITHSAYLGSRSSAWPGAVNGAPSCGLQAGAQLSGVGYKMCKEPLEKVILTTFFG